MKKKNRKNPLSKSFLKKVGIRTTTTMVDGVATQVHAAEGPDSKTLVILQQGKKFFLANKGNLSQKVPATANDLKSLAGNIAAGNTTNILG